LIHAIESGYKAIRWRFSGVLRMIRISRLYDSDKGYPRNWTASILRLAMALTILAWPAMSAAIEIPHLESIVLAEVQPHSNNPAVIWYDNFDTDRLAQYLEPKPGSPEARRSTQEALGGTGASMECYYAAGSRGVGNRKLVFGDCPFGRPLRAKERFTNICWRLYVKHQKGWVGAPAKMSRATGFVSSKWNQAFISHVWSAGLFLTLDPASGVRDGQVGTTQYNDFAHLRWLGNKPVGRFPIHATEESGRWVCVESQLRLNTPGKHDGVAVLWVDGRLDSARTNLDFIGTYTGTGSTVNAVFLEAYWNEGSPVDQYRWYDDFVVSTAPIGPLTSDPNPILIKAASENDAPWQVEIAADPFGSNLVWQSHRVPRDSHRVTVRIQTGTFVGTAHDRTFLAPGTMYFCRVRQQNRDGTWSAWGPWHQPFYASPRPSRP
jgi:hypothetical protein